MGGTEISALRLPPRIAVLVLIDKHLHSSSEVTPQSPFDVLALELVCPIRYPMLSRGRELGSDEELRNLHTEK